MITTDGVDWATLLLQTLDESPLLLLDLHHKPSERSKHINPWQCHVLASFLSSLAPRIKSEILDWKLCSLSYTHKNHAYSNNHASSSDTKLTKEGIAKDDHDEEHGHFLEYGQIALREMLTSIRKAENYFVNHVTHDHGPQEFLLMAASSCNGEAIYVHIHNIFWCFSGFTSMARQSLGYSDTRLSRLMEDQISRWDNLVSHYFRLGAQTLDMRHLASIMQTYTLEPSLSENELIDASSPMKHLLSRRLDFLILTQCKEKELEDEDILDLIEIDFKDLKDVKKKKLHENVDDGDGLKKINSHIDRIEATLGGIQVSLQRFSSMVALKKQVALLLRVIRNPFILELLGWSVDFESDGSRTCYLVMEATESDLKSSITSALVSAANRPISVTSKTSDSIGESEFPTGHGHLVSPFPFYIALDMMLQISRGMWYLHHNGIAHKNLCSSSVLMIDPSKPSHRQKFYDVLLSDEAPGLHTRLKLSDIGTDNQDIPNDSLDLHSSFHEDVKSFGYLCIEILTGKQRRIVDESFGDGPMSGTNGNGDVDILSNLMLPLTVPNGLIDCVKACCDPEPKNRPDFSAICGLLRRLKLVVYYNLNQLDQVLKTKALATIYGRTHKGVASTDESIYANVEDSSVSSYNLANTFALNLLDINVKLLYTSTPTEIYAHIASEALSLLNGEDKDNHGVSSTSIPMKELLAMAAKLGEATREKEKKEENGSNTQWKHMHNKIITSKASTLETTLVVDGCRGLLRNGWINTTMGLGSLEMWLNMRYMAKLDWKQVQKVGLAIALCVRYASKSSISLKLGSYSSDQGHCIDGFYPICPSNVLLNSQLKAALLLDNTSDAWNSLVQWAGVHPHLSKDGNTLISIDAYTTFYYGHILDCVIGAHESQLGEQKPAVSSLDQHFETVLTDLAQRCIQLKCLSMSEVVTLLLDSECLNPLKASSHEIEPSQALQ